MDWWGKIRHNLHFGGVKAIAGAESVGEVSNQFADTVSSLTAALLAALFTGSDPTRGPKSMRSKQQQQHRIIAAYLDHNLAAI